MSIEDPDEIKKLMENSPLSFDFMDSKFVDGLVERPYSYLAFGKITFCVGSYKIFDNDMANYVLDVTIPLKTITVSNSSISCKILFADFYNRKDGVILHSKWVEYLNWGYYKSYSYFQFDGDLVKKLPNGRKDYCYDCMSDELYPHAMTFKCCSCNKIILGG